MSDRTVRVVVADDQQIVREGLVALLELMDGVEVVGAASTGEQAVQLVADGNADVVLMDLRMPVLDGVGATRRITADHQRSPSWCSPRTPTTSRSRWLCKRERAGT